MKSKKKSEIPHEKWQWKYNLTKSTGCIKSNSKREVHSSKGFTHSHTHTHTHTIPQMNNLIYQLKKLEKNKTQTQKKEESKLRRNK